MSPLFTFPSASLLLAETSETIRSPISPATNFFCKEGKWKDEWTAKRKKFRIKDTLPRGIQDGQSSKKVTFYVAKPSRKGGRLGNLVSCGTSFGQVHDFAVKDNELYDC